jgi:cardiolipin synthase
MSMMNLIFLIYQVIAVSAVIHVIMDNRQPAKTMVWALLIYFVPVAGIIAYIFFGVNTRRQRLVSRRSLDQLTRRSMMEFAGQPDLELPESYKPLIDLFVNESFSLPFNGNRTQLLTDGYQFFPALLHDIAEARSHIHIDIYIFEDDALGMLVSDALIAKARQGVEVRIIYDDVGCWGVDRRFFERMREAGIEVAPFLPVRFPQFTSKANYRNHRKLIVIDGRVGYIGGMNIALRYVKGNMYKKERMAVRISRKSAKASGLFETSRKSAEG